MATKDGVPYPPFKKPRNPRRPKGQQQPAAPKKTPNTPPKGRGNKPKKQIGW